ncbi:uncharacterized protein LOC6054432 [Culex quinquefasciatus]|uniref:uncharacterized protein LOC6054432 n=1 Tax=Culex quinquefasciatus TaxID=7176 RepID=UPI0018E3778B|nr:uncharacterized protein LOC6054432 [Culex quinquefasciatus]
MKPNLLPPPLATGAIDLLQEMLLERGAIRTDFTLYQDQRRNLLLVPEQGKCDADATPATYLVGKHEEALVWYNRSICFAEKGTDQLATGIGRRFTTSKASKSLHCTTSILPRSMIIRKSCCKQQIAARRARFQVRGWALMWILTRRFPSWPRE